MIKTGKEIKKSLKPGLAMGKIASRTVKPGLVEKLAPQAPGENVSFKRRLIETITGKEN